MNRHQTPAGPWRVWVDTRRKILSFHPEAGGQYLAFQSRELFLSCVDRYISQQYRCQ